MKKITQLVIIFCFFPAMWSWLPSASAAPGNPFALLKVENYRVVVDEIAGRVVARLPDDIHFRLLGIGSIAGDDGALVDALTAKIKKETRYHLIERKDLNKILSEQGIQLSPVTDDRQPVEPGKIKGVEGLLMGRIIKKQCSFLFCNMDVFIKLDNVETGDVVFAEHFQSQYVPPAALYGLAAIIVLILFVLYVNRKKHHARKRAVALVHGDSADLQTLQNELKKARNNLNRAHDELVAKDKMKGSVAVRDARENLNALIFNVEQSPGPHSDALEKNTKTDLKSHHKAMGGLAKNILAESEKLLKMAVSGDDPGIQAATEALGREIKNASNRFQERKAGKA